MVIVWLAGCGDPADASRSPTEAQVAVPRPPEHVVIDDGELIGRRDGTSYLFGNIPYAKPPVDALRWRRPQKNDPWSAPRDATKRGNRCHDHVWVNDPRTASEDCLNLDVWTPDPRAAAGLPVMVYLRGGSRRGYRVDPADSRYKGVTLEDGRVLSERGVVVVTLNTRRGALGFFAHPDLAAEGSGGGNQGLHDQQLALRWVQQNIAQFGGDAEQVTLWGQDAGAEDACLHAVAPTSHGLFQRIIAQSGACTGYQNALEVAEEDARQATRYLGCTGPDALNCLRRLPAVAPGSERSAMWSDPLHVPTPTVDGTLIPDQPRRMFQRGEFARVPFILGGAQDDSDFSSWLSPPADVFDRALGSTLGAEHVADIRAHYGTRVWEFSGLLWGRILTDAWVLCATYDMAMIARDAGADTFMYLFQLPRFDWTKTLVLRGVAGDDLPYVFGTVRTQSDALAEAMQTYWTNFAKYANPNGPAASGAAATLSRWPSFSSSDHGTRMVLLPPPPSLPNQTNYGAADCEFWRTKYEKIFASGHKYSHR